jgi:hypothetical protein
MSTGAGTRIVCESASGAVFPEPETDTAGVVDQCIALSLHLRISFAGKFQTDLFLHLFYPLEYFL